MKRLLVIVVAIFASVMTQELRALAAFGGGLNNIPLFTLAGGYGSTVQGSLVVCLDPDTFGLESCATAGAQVIPISYLAVGQITWDFNGNGCGTYSQVQSNLPVDVSPPLVSVGIVTGKSLNYDPASGTGDDSFTTYSGGKCNGAKFDGTGATIVSTGTSHFVASSGGKRLDGIFTSLTGPSGGFGDFSISFSYLKQ